MAYSEGDSSYRYTEQVGMLPRGFKGMTKGVSQEIVFSPLGDLRVGGPALGLKAKSDRGLPVEYYVAFGPARIEAGRLLSSEVPRRAVFPIEISVVAYQFGRGVEPLVKTAEPKTQVINLMGP